jgi:hypothetical protein
MTPKELASDAAWRKQGLSVQAIIVTPTGEP